MSSFTRSQPVNKNKVFILNRSEIEKRLDPDYYHLERRFEIDRLKKSKHPLSSLKLTASFSKITLSENLDNLPYIGLEDIESNTGAYSNSSQKESFRTALYFKKGDVLFPKLRPYLNKVHLAEFDGICSTEFVILNSKKVSTKFLSAFLRSSIVVNQTKHMMSGNTLPRLQTEDIENILVPIPVEASQNKVVSIMDSALEQKKQNEAEAEKLLASIDNYLLKELGITLPTPHENILKNRIFKTTISKTVSGDRFDPLYHQGSIYGGLEKSKFKYKNFKEISKYIINGFAAGKQDQNIFGEGIIQIRPTNISDKREFVFNKNVYIDLSRKNDLKNELLYKNEVLFNNTNSQELVGKACVFNLEGDYFCSNHITRIGLYEEYISDYVGVILNLYQKNKVFYKSCINWNNQSGINLDILKTIKIPIPPLPKQKEIAEHITDIRKQAQQLKEKTNEALKKASEEIEKILLT